MPTRLALTTVLEGRRSTWTPMRGRTVRKKSLALAAALGLGLGLVVATPAQAAQTVQLTTKTSSSNGYANLNATLAFTDQGRGIDLRGSITDRCPADGNGAYSIITVRFVDGGFQSYT